MENMKEFNEYIDSMRDDILTEYRLGNNTRDDWCDIVHEYADGSQYVIYYGMAWELVNMVRRCDGALFDDAQLGLDGFGDSQDINQMMTRLAYECIYQQLMLALNDAIDEAEG
jgi:hypothetical protein